jgi:outer membrane protein assembly factor BamE (lipoprotein component of BamABCDE complex)
MTRARRIAILLATAALVEREMTVGIVQREIRAGLTQDQVAEALGSPNIVTRDASGNETWIYDKIASEASYSNSSAYGTILILGGSTASGAAATTQRTLTVVIKFDANRQVETFSYHASKF